MLIALWTAPGLRDAVLPGVVASGLALVLALTVPHLIVVGVLDRHQLTGGTRAEQRHT